jgi:hypothetical protein
MIICSSSNIDLIQGVTGYGTAADGATDWRIENTATGVFNVLNSPNLLAPNLSIIESGNVGIGTIPGTGTNKLQVQGNANVSGDTLSKTYTATNTTAGTNDILTMRYDTTNGLRFQQTLIAVNDVRYDVIQKTNNVDSTTPTMSFYKGNVGIGTTNPNAELQVTCSSTATNPDTPGTIIGLYVHNPTNTATSQNSVIYNRIANLSTGKVIFAFNVAGSYGCSMVMNGNDATNRLLRFNNSSDATGTDLMVINNTNGNVSIGNTTTDTHRLNVTGSVNVSGGYLVGGNAFKPATAVLADTATVLATSRNIAGVPFNGSGAIDIPYFNLTNKITAGTGISLTTGSATTSPSISTNLTAGTNVTFTGTAPNITINAAGGTASQWTTTGNNIYYNTGNVGIGTNNPFSALHLHTNATTTESRMILSDNTTTASGSRGLHLVKVGNADGYLMNYENNPLIFGTNGSERMHIASNGNIGIGTNNPQGKLDIYGFIYSSGHKQPFSRNGTVSGVYYVDIPTLFGLETTTVHTCDIVLSWHVVTNGTERFASIYGISSVGTVHNPSEVGYTERSYSGTYTATSGNIIARSIIERMDMTTKIRITRIVAPEARGTYICETAYGVNNIGSFQNISIGWVRDSNNGNVSSLRIQTSHTTANIYGNYTATYYHV